MTLWQDLQTNVGGILCTAASLGCVTLGLQTTVRTARIVSVSLTGAVDLTFCFTNPAACASEQGGDEAKGQEESHDPDFPPPHPLDPLAGDTLVEAFGKCSFTPDTAVTTNHGQQAIGTLQVGERVLAYNPKTGQMEPEPILHVWINHDHDLVDLMITTTTKGEHGKPATKTSEVIHTNQKHPFFTLEHGFLPVGQITLRMHLLRADGRVGVVTGWKMVPGTKTMYNLEVAQDHTFTVGVGQWVVHNECGPIRVSRKGLDMVKTHLSRPEFLSPEGTITPENAAMISRLEDALNQGSLISGADATFYLHELNEFTLMERGVPYEVAHEQALAKYGVSPYSLYHPDVIRSFPQAFNTNWFDFWGIGGP